jgi:arabinogalactan endo-1,4-beta-galactosidase
MSLALSTLRRPFPPFLVCLAATYCLVGCAESDAPGNSMDGTSSNENNGPVTATVPERGATVPPSEPSDTTPTSPSTPGLPATSPTSSDDAVAGSGGAPFPTGSEPQPNGIGGTAEDGGSGSPFGGAGTSFGGDGPIGGGSGGNGGSGGAGNGGSGGPSNPEPSDNSFMLGADISSVQEAIEGGATYVDTDGQTKSILELLAAHGFNTVRLRTFVEPGADYGYASCGQGGVYCDTESNVRFGKEVKDAGMRLLLDFHYSDTWADPGKQVIPEAWRDVSSIEELAGLVRDYTQDSVQQMIDGGARPDIVQVGNEITPGMLIHVPTSRTDCYGNNSEVNPSGITGQASQGNWDNLAELLRAGIDGVKAADPTIAIMLHVENTESAQGVSSWVENALSRGVEFDVLGLSCYTAFQGEPSVWRNTFQAVAMAYPDLRFVVAEYNPERTEANRMIRDLPNGQGMGTFFWEPTQSGTWGNSMFTRDGNTYRANESDFAEYDGLRSELGL